MTEVLTEVLDGTGSAWRGSSSYSIRSAGGGGGTQAGIGVSTPTGSVEGSSNDLYHGSSGPGGLLIVYSDTLYNNGTMSSKGSNGGNGRSGGGSSGGGSINIFANYLKANSSTTASGGTITGSDAPEAYARGGAGGAGSRTTTVVAPDINSKVKEIVLEINEEYTITPANFEITNQKEIQTGLVSADNMQYEILDTSIATIDSTGKITPIKEGKTKIKATEPLSKVVTYIFLVIKNGSVPDIKTGYDFTIALKKDGTVWSYGKNDIGQLGNGTYSNSVIPKKIEGLNNIEKISSGYNHVLCLNNIGEVYSWGSNSSGQLGIGDNLQRNIPEKIQNLSNIVKIEAYKNTSLAINSEGEVYVWGTNYTNIPTKLSTTFKTVDISGDLLLKENGKVVLLSNLTTELTQADKISKISVGSGHYLALMHNGNVISWGNNSLGELGNGTIGDTTSKIIASEIYDVYAGVNLSMLVKENGDLFVCGSNTNYRLGLNSTVSTGVLTKISGPVKVEAVGPANYYHSAIMDSDGNIWTTGKNTYGQLGVEGISEYRTFTKLVDKKITSNIENITIDLGESKLIQSRLENLLNLKTDLLDDNQENFSITIQDVTKLSIEGSTITSLAEGNTSITIKHIPTNITKQIQINIVDSTTGFIISSIPKINYKYGELLDVNGGKLTVTKSSGDTVIDLTPQMVSGYNPNVLGTQILTVSLSNFTQTYEILVSDYIEGITVTPPTKTTYQYGENLDLNGGSFVENFASGAVGTEIILESGIVSGYNSNIVGTQTITVKHITTNTIDDSSIEFIETFNINVVDYVVGISITPPTKSVYNHGESLDLTGGTILETMASGAINNVTMTDEMITELNDSLVEMSPVLYDETNKLDKTLKITYGGTNQNYSITIINDIRSIELTNLPRTEYNVNDMLDVTGGEILITRALGTSLETITSGMVTGFDSSAEAINMSLTVTYTENGITKTTTYFINVADIITGFNILTFPKTNYKYGEVLDVTGGKLTVQRGSGDAQINITSEMVSGYNPNTLGEQTLTVTYHGFTQIYEVAVSDFETGIIVSPPTKINYKYNENLDLTNGLITTVMASGSIGNSVAITSGMTTGYNNKIIGNQTITVIYTTTNTIDGLSTDFTDSFDVSVQDYVVGISVTPPTKTNYQYGEELDYDGCEVLEIMASGVNGNDIVVTIGMFNGFNSNTLGNQTLTVTYTTTNTIDGVSIDFTDTFDVTVEDYAANIAITEPTKSVYNHGETIDLTGGTIVETMASGAINNVTMTLGMITELNDSPVVMNPGSYDGTNKLDKTLKITHGGITQNYPITIINDVKSIEVTTLPKTDYNVNDLLDVTSGEITITRAVGTSTETLTSGMITGFDTSLEATNMLLTVSYTENGITQTTTYNVNITDLITGFTITTTPKTAYQYGETLDVNGGKLTVQRGSGETIIDITSDMVSGYNSNTLGSQTLTVTYGGYTQTYDITVSDYVTGITVASPSKLTYQYGELLDLTGATLVENYASGLVGTEVTVTSGMMSGYNENTLGSQTLTVTYSGFTDTFDVTVEDYVANIAITEPTKSVYNHGETIDLTGGTIVEIMASGAINNVTMTLGMITELNDSPVVMNPGSYDGTNKLDKILKITHGGTTQNYPITIINDVKSIAVTTLPKTDYNVNDLLDVTSGEITITRAVGTSVETLTDGMITGFDTSVEATNMPLTVTYIENGITQTTNYNINIVDSITGFTITTTPKISYQYGESLEVTGGKITVTRGSGDNIIDLTSEMVSGYNPNTLGNQTVTVTYGGFTQNYEVTVSDFVVGITVTSPSKLIYQYGELLDLTGATLVENYASGLVGTEVTVTSGMMSGYNENTLGSQTLTVTYSGFTDTFDVTVADYVANISITEPTKSVYNHGETIDLTGGTIVETMASGAINNITMTLGMITELNDSPVVMNPGSYDGTNKLDKTLKITHGGRTQNYSITIINDVRSIEVTTLPKTEYNVNDLLDVTLGEITITRAVGTSIETLTSGMITGFDTSVEATNMLLTVSYTENGITQTTTYNVNITDLVTGFTITTTPKTNYLYGEELDVTGGKLTVQRGSGNTEIDLTSGMVSGYNSNVLGNQTLTVTHGGYTQTYDITVSDYVTGITVTSPSKLIYQYGELLDLTGATLVENYASGLVGTEVTVTSGMMSGYNENTLGSQTLTVTYSGFTDTFDVTVEDYVANIAITEPTKSVYNHGETIALTGGTIVETMASGAINNVTMTLGMITELNDSPVVMNPGSYDGTNKLDKILKITHGGTTQNYPITIINDVKSIAVTTLPKTDYNVNDLLDVTSGQITITRAVGTSVETLTDVMVTSFDSSVEGTNMPLTVTYTENGITQTTTYNVNITDLITGFTITTTPKTAYQYGETLDVNGGKLTVQRGSGDTIIDLTSEMVSGYDSNKLGNQTLTVSYVGFSQTYDITVSDYVIDIIITGLDKTNYLYGQELELSNANIMPVMASGIGVDSIQLSLDMISGYDNTLIGTQIITITYEGISKNINITVENGLEKIEMFLMPNKLVYKFGEQIDVTDSQIIKTNLDSTTEIINVLNSMVSGYSENTLGVQAIIVSYTENGITKTTTFNITVEDYLQDIQLVNIKTEYLINEDLNLTNSKIVPLMASGITGTEVSVTQEMVTGFNTSIQGACEIEITYFGIVKKYSIIVSDPIIGITIQGPSKIDYLYGEELDLSGATVIANRLSGEIEEPINITEDMITGYNSSILGIQTITVVYLEKTNTFNVTVLDWDKELKITSIPKINYEYGEALDTENGKVAIYTASGVISSIMPEGEAVEITAGMVTGFDSTKEGVQNLTVTWNGFSTTYNINIVNSIISISMNTDLEIYEVEYGKELETYEFTLKVKKVTGDYIILLTPSMISGFDKNTIGEQKITVMYGGRTLEFLIIVKENIDNSEIEEPSDDTIIRNDSVTTTNENTEKNIENTQYPDKNTEQEQNLIPDDSKQNTDEAEEKPVITLGDIDKKEVYKEKIIIVGISSISVLTSFTILIILRKKYKFK